MARAGVGMDWECAVSAYSGGRQWLCTITRAGGSGGLWGHSFCVAAPGSSGQSRGEKSSLQQHLLYLRGTGQSVAFPALKVIVIPML